MSTSGISGRGRAELARTLAGGRRFVTPEVVASALGIDAATAAKKLSRWTEEGWLRRARRGLYVPVPVDVADPRSWSEDPLVLADAVWAPCYFTGWTAASQWALTEQTFRTTVVRTTQRVRRSTQRLLDHEYLVGHTKERHMTWGLVASWRGERRLWVADPARVVIDVLDDPALGGGIRHIAEILETYLAQHPAETLIDYGDRLGNRTVFKRLGYLVQVTDLDVDNLVASCAARISTGVSLLDPTGPEESDRVPEWGLRVNVRISRAEPS
jgi:predicted transcriptional regulator of viral defense system